MRLVYLAMFILCGASGLSQFCFQHIRSRGRFNLFIGNLATRHLHVQSSPSGLHGGDQVDSLFRNLGIIPELVKGLSEQGWVDPTPVQKAVVPRLLSGESLVIAAPTGSGKTVSFVLPVVQKLAIQETQGYVRQIRRPRCLILVPTRDLARQVLVVVKCLSHYSKISSCAVLGGEQYGLQKRKLDRLVDIVVASPGRLVQHKEQGNLFLSQVDTVIIDEVDTMLMQGFGPDIRSIVKIVVGHNRRGKAVEMSDLASSTGGGTVDRHQPVQFIMATATLTKAVKSLLTEINQGGFDMDYSDPANKRTNNESEKSRTNEINLKFVEVDGLHRSLPNVRHVVEELKGRDKFAVLQTILQRSGAAKISRTLLFCNSVASVRAVQYHLAESGTPALSYHGELNSREREQNLLSFRNGTSLFMVCTDIAARGLDIPEIDHVVLVDFPLNPIDYLHRVGRCGRADRKGLVTSLVTKGDKVLSDAVQAAIATNRPLDSLSSDKRRNQKQK